MTDVPGILKTKLNSLEISDSSWSHDQTTAAIMVPLVCEGDNWQLLFTHRTDHVRTHQNEVSFPGGSYDPIDTILVETALREVNEEIGVKKAQITILGAMDPVQTITGFQVFPFVGLMDWPIKLIINKSEVETIFTIPIDWLKDPDNYYEADFQTKTFGIRKVLHYKDYDGQHLWGFTARVTQQMLMLLK